MNSSEENVANKRNIESDEEVIESNKKMQKIDEDDDYDSDTEDEKSLSLHDSDTEEECPSPNIPKIVLSEAEKRREKNIQEREQLWEQQKDKYENMFR